MFKHSPTLKKDKFFYGLNRAEEGYQGFLRLHLCVFKVDIRDSGDAEPGDNDKMKPEPREGENLQLWLEGLSCLALLTDQKSKFIFFTELLVIHKLTTFNHCLELIFS